MKSTMLVGISLVTPSRSKSSSMLLTGGASILSVAAVEHHPGGRDDSTAPRRGKQVGVRSFEAHLRVEGADQELTNRHGFAMREERADPEVGIHAFHS